MKSSSFENHLNKILMAAFIVFSILTVSSGEHFSFAQSTENSTMSEQTRCIYQGSEYSAGSVVNMPGGAKTCHSSGVWV